MKPKLAIILATLVAIPFANAALVNVNFNGFTGGNLQSEVESTLSGPGGGSSSSWNQYAANSSSGTMVDSTGANTSVTFTTNFSEGRTGNTSNLPVFRSTLTDFGRGASRTLTINGLTINGLYDIWVIAYRDSSSAAERLSGTWSTTNTTTSSSSQLLDSSGTRNGTTFEEGVNYILFENVQASGSGVIAFDGQGTIIDLPVDGNDFRLGLSGFQINAVPEPSSTALLGLGGLALILRRRM